MVLDSHVHLLVVNKAGTFVYFAGPAYRILEKQNGRTMNAPIPKKNLTHLQRVLLFKDSSGASGGAGSSNDGLVLYYDEKAARETGLTHYWNELQRVYKATQDKETPSNEITLRTKPGNAPGLSPIIQTVSGLGILKNGFQYKRFLIVSPAKYALED